jgi:hypothetical protein
LGEEQHAEVKLGFASTIPRITARWSFSSISWPTTCSAADPGTAARADLIDEQGVWPPQGLRGLLRARSSSESDQRRIIKADHADQLQRSLRRAHRCALPQHRHRPGDAQDTADAVQVGRRQGAGRLDRLGLLIHHPDVGV